MINPWCGSEVYYEGWRFKNYHVTRSSSSAAPNSQGSDSSSNGEMEGCIVHRLIFMIGCRVKVALDKKSPQKSYDLQAIKANEAIVKAFVEHRDTGSASE